MRVSPMSRANATREAWHPQSSQDREAVLRELQEVVASPHFCNSKRYPALLQYIVENTLAGKTDLLKERTLGVEVFDRPATYDTNADTVVRYTAGEVRKRLLLYYSEHHRRSGIRISLPAGSYIPEFLHGHYDAEDEADSADHSGSHGTDSGFHAEAAGNSQDDETDSHAAAGSAIPAAANRIGTLARRLLWPAAAGIVLTVVVAGIWWRSRPELPQTAVESFWGPVLRDQHTVSLCTGGVVFQQNNFSGVITASKDNEYPFVSMQAASAIAQISGLLERSGVSTQLLPSPTTPLNDLREHSVVLFGGYNNQWAMRLLDPQRFHFTPEPVESITDRMQPQVNWTRDKSLPYSSADDYALIARVRDPTTGSWVVVLAGLGRNGTEAAAQFVASPHYMQLLRDQIGRDFSNRNLEAVLKVRVIEGKTGAPSILAAHTW